MPLHNGHRIWAEAELLPWDEAAFGFPVARLVTKGDAPRDETSGVEASLRHWTLQSGVRVVGANVPAQALDWIDFLPRIGFTCIDLALTVSLSRLAHRPRLVRPAALRPAVEADYPGIVKIARTAFDFGRYHRDPRFPRELADRRFAKWLERALAEPSSGQRFYVAGPPGAPGGFMFLTIKDGQADWHLAAVTRQPQQAVSGPMLFAGALDCMEAEDVRHITSRISAANTAVLNIYAALGFRCIEPEFTFHWHATNDK